MCLQPEKKATTKDKKASGKKEQVNILELKKVTGIGIRMSRLKVPWQEVGDAIVALDSKALETAEDVQTIMACLPDADDKKKFQVCSDSMCGSPLVPLLLGMFGV